MPNIVLCLILLLVLYMALLLTSVETWLVRVQKNQAEWIFSIVKLNARKSSERYQNLIPSYNIKGCFCFVLKGFLPIWICVSLHLLTVDILDSRTGRFESDWYKVSIMIKQGITNKCVACISICCSTSQPQPFLNNFCVYSFAITFPFCGR